MSSNLPLTPNADPISDYFSRQSLPGLSISPDNADAVIGYFQSVTGNAATGSVLASSVMYTALNQGLDIMQLMDEFRKLNGAELNIYLTMFLNINRTGTSLLGISNSPTLSKYVSRSILA